MDGGGLNQVGLQVVTSCLIIFGAIDLYNLTD